MFKAEKSNSPAWQRILDDKGNYIASLNETYSGNWAIQNKNTIGEWLTKETFSNGTKAATWLWKNREEMGEPFSSYGDDRPLSKDRGQLTKVEIPVIEDVSEDLFRGIDKPKRK